MCFILTIICSTTLVAGFPKWLRWKLRRAPYLIENRDHDICECLQKVLSILDSCSPLKLLQVLGSIRQYKGQAFVAIDTSLVILIREEPDALEMCKLEISSSAPCLESVCSLSYCHWHHQVLLLNGRGPLRSGSRPQGTMHGLDHFKDIMFPSIPLQSVQ